MITEALRAKAHELLETECVDKGAWHQLVTQLLESETSAEFGLPLKQEPKYTVNLDGRLVNRTTGQTIPDDEPIMIFRAKDDKAFDAVDFYYDVCDNEAHKRVVQARLEVFRKFARAHPERMREPD